MTQDPSTAGEANEQGAAEQGGAGREGNPFGGSPTFPDPTASRPTGNATGFNGSYTETEHHTQREYDAEHQHPGSGEPSAEEGQED